MFEMIEHAVRDNQLVTAFMVVGVIVWVSGFLSKHLTGGRVAGSAIAVLAGLALAYWGGVLTGKSKGLADLTMFSGMGLMGGAMMRDFCIVATASEVHVDEAKKAGWLGAVALLLGTVLPFIVGVCVAWAFGYRDPVALSTIGAGAVTYIVGPVTGAAIGASSDIMALSIATGVVKAILVMVTTPALAGFMKLNNPQAAMVFGGLAGTVSGVSAGLAATDRRLVPYGALVATFHTGLGCLMAPSVMYLAVKALVG
jgi:malonate transporter MadM subunit